MPAVRYSSTLILNSRFVSYVFSYDYDMVLLEGGKKEKQLTQKQFAELLGVNDRSVSRWETGYCMPDLSLLQVISEELEVSISELLNGRRMTEEERPKENETIEMIIDLVMKDRLKKSNSISRCFSAAICCFMIVILHKQFSFLSLLFEAGTEHFLTYFLTVTGIFLAFIGFYHNRHDNMMTTMEIQQLLKSKRRGKMKTTQEMIQYAGKYQDIPLKHYKKAFSMIEKSLADNEQVIFAATANSLSINELQMMWHVALAVTKNRLVIAGQEIRKGMWLTHYSTESFPILEIESIQMVPSMLHSSLSIQTPRGEFRIDFENAESVEEIAKDLKDIVSQLQ